MDKLEYQATLQEAKHSTRDYVATLKAEGAVDALYDIASQLGISICKGARIVEGCLDHK